MMLQPQLSIDATTNALYNNRVPIDTVVDDLPVYANWHQVKTKPSRYTEFSPPSNAIRAMKQWCSDNTRHSWSSYIGEFFFEDSKDAMWFTIKWS